MKRNYIKPKIAIGNMELDSAMLQFSQVKDNNASQNGTSKTSVQSMSLDNNLNGGVVETAKQRGFYEGYDDEF